jgi:threonine dehydrogenase-like Zn-dependent dehydrogenase
MKAVVYKGPFNVAVEEVADPQIEHPGDVIVRITSTAICGSDLHMYEGRTAAQPGVVLNSLIRTVRPTGAVGVPGGAAPRFVVSHELPLEQAPEAYEKFDKRIEGYTKVVLHPGG